MNESFNLADYVQKSTNDSGVPLRISGTAVLSLVVRRLIH